MFLQVVSELHEDKDNTEAYTRIYVYSLFYLPAVEKVLF